MNAGWSNRLNSESQTSCEAHTHRISMFLFGGQDIVCLCDALVELVILSSLRTARNIWAEGVKGVLRRM